MSKHPHAESMVLYAQDAMKNLQPWLNWEYYNGCAWLTLSDHPAWSSGSQYRQKPKTIRIGEYDVPEPIKGRLPAGTNYYITSLLNTEPVQNVWSDIDEDYKYVYLGICFLTVADAKLQATALLSLLKSK